MGVASGAGTGRQHLELQEVSSMKHPYFKVNLDEIGSFFWLNCDGTRTVKDIAELHKKRFGEKVEPLYERITQFISSLEKNRFISLEK